MRLIVCIVLSLTFSNTLFSKEAKKLSVQSIRLKEAIKSMPAQIEVFLDSFPKTKSEFSKLCLYPKGEIYDCSDLFYPHLEKAISTHPKKVGSLLAELASSIDYDADAPNYLQDLWQKFCLKNTSAFVKSLVELKSSSKQARAVKYLNEYLHHPNNRKIQGCIDKLEKGKFLKWAKLAKKNLHSNKKPHH